MIRTRYTFHHDNSVSDIYRSWKSPILMGIPFPIPSTFTQFFKLTIGFDPKDALENGLTSEQAQALCPEFARKHFAEYQTLVVTHTDVHHHACNIHTHIVINSVRKETVERQDYMDQSNDYKAGYNHRQTKQFLQFLQKELMAMCSENGLHQVELLTPAPIKITNEEYRAHEKGQKKLDETTEKVIAAGMKPTMAIFQTQQQFLRDTIDDAAATAASFEEFQSILLEKYKIAITDKRGCYSYLHPDRTKNISERTLGTNYGKGFICPVTSSWRILLNPLIPLRHSS